MHAAHAARQGLSPSRWWATGPWGLAPSADGWSAAVGISVAYQGFHCVVLMVLGGFLLARSWSGRLVPRARATLDNVGLLWQAAAIQGIPSCGRCPG